MKMEPIVSSETSSIRTQTPGNYPKRNNLHLEHGESLRTRSTRCYWMLYCTYNLLNMFRALICPSSGARDYTCRHCRIWCVMPWLLVVSGQEQGSRLCGNNTSIVSSSWWWAYKWPKYIEQIISAITSSWFSSVRREQRVPFRTREGHTAATFTHIQWEAQTFPQLLSHKHPVGHGCQIDV